MCVIEFALSYFLGLDSQKDQSPVSFYYIYYAYKQTYDFLQYRNYIESVSSLYVGLKVI